MEKGRVAESQGPRWTRADDYVVAMARKRTARQERQPQRRTQPESPRLLLSTIPFLALIGSLGVLAVAIMVAAFPGSQPLSRPLKSDFHEQGVASRGWFQEATKEFHR